MRTRRRRLIARKNGQLETPVNVPTPEPPVAIVTPPTKQAKKQARK
jgi:hypothetical protein